MAMELYEVGFKSGLKIRVEADATKVISEMYSGTMEKPDSTHQVWGYDGSKGGLGFAITVSDVSYVVPVSALK